jgi:hypothetical protein
MVCVLKTRQFIKKFKLNITLHKKIHVSVSNLSAPICSNNKCYITKYYNPNIFVHVLVEVESF